MRNPDQADIDADGTGDACEEPEVAEGAVPKPTAEKRPTRR